MKLPGCGRCRRRFLSARAERRGDYGYFTFGNTGFGLFNVKAAELILRLSPRAPTHVSSRSIDAHHRKQEWRTVERHLPHVDVSAPGILATITIRGKRRLYLIEGFHRAERHRRERTDWTCFVLTPEETYAILTPPSLVKP